jgi:integrative and conjugative element protein (TIGR02256 family)
MTPPVDVVWLWNMAWARMTEEANSKVPLETGGLLMGYTVPAEKVLVVTDVIGPGPNAVHQSASFIPDYEFHEREVRRHHLESGGRTRYLGDWHSHPDGVSILSAKDKRTLHRIGVSPEARVSTPLMLLVCGRPGRWTANAFAGEFVKARFGRRRCIPHPTPLRFFDPS